MNMVPCPGCTRHVRSADTHCPFCGDALPLALRQQRRAVAPRMGRAAMFAFGAAMAVSTASGCDDTSTPEVDSGSEVDAGGGVAPAYGAPAEDAGTPDPDGGGGPAPLYGGAPGD
ncbi:MAG: hypothetical protein AB8I08_27495 [Sandaracinaceae bacterium]